MKTYCYLLFTVLSVLLIGACTNSNTAKEESLRDSRKRLAESRSRRRTPPENESNEKSKTRQVIKKEDQLSFYVMADSGIDYSRSPRGKKIGNLPFNSKVTISEYSNVFEQVGDPSDSIIGQWVGMKKDSTLVYVNNAFLSTSSIVLDKASDSLLAVEPIEKYKDFNVFYLYGDPNDKQERDGLVNISAIYKLSNHSDSIAVSNEYLGSPKAENIQHFKLDSLYRKRMIDGSAILETDKLFIYNYQLDTLITLNVADLEASASIDVYTDPNYEIKPYNYLYGFEISHSIIKFLGKNLNYTLVSIGAENPFETGQMSPMIWEKIALHQFPLNIKELYPNKRFDKTNIGDYYRFETDELSYYFGIPESIEDNGYLTIVEKQSNQMILMKVFKEFDSSYLIRPALSDQAESDILEHWTGRLFKNKPKVFFGLQYHSFGCTEVGFIDQSVGSIWIRCDNRH